MKKSSNILLILLLSLSTLISGTLIHTFVATSNGDAINLSWETSIEENIKEFEILRGRDKDNLAPIARVTAKGNNSNYTYVDENAYKTSSTFYSYGLILVDNSGSRSQVVMHTQVVHDNVSSVKRTWGSIKALFR
ncbi:MAG: hypothetical protein H6613_19945 [Ignavibacteriales bacterium]|nr:hypothetical protein [Ignavibacteriota bacterium]MCB9250640.1 hypothetical protein [Ignavibacteriales bacterium]